MQIDSLIVHNYRCISKMELDGLSPITVLVGRNNTGKSALLEACAFASTAEAAWYDSFDTDLISSVVKRRGGWEYADMMIKIGEHKAEIHIKGENIEGNVEIVRKLEDLPDDASSKITALISDYIDSAIKRSVDIITRERRVLSPRDLQSFRIRMENKISRIKSDVLRQLETSFYYTDKLSGASEYAALVGEKFDEIFTSLSREEDFLLHPLPIPTEVIRSSPKKRSRTLFMLTPSTRYLAELQRRLAISGELINLINLIRERVGYFTDIREVDEDFLVFLKGLKRPVPLDSMGDGFRAKLGILAAIANVKGGVVLMEEPEIRLHPGFMSSIADQIAETAARKEAQYIISTHSLEFLRFLLEANAELLKVVRMYMIEGSAEIDYEVLDGKEAIEEIEELTLDLRGV